MKVMIVDEAKTRTKLEPMIKEWGYEVTAASGEKALKALQGETRPVLLLLGGGKSGGIKLCTALKKEKTPGPLYVILLTARSSKEDIARGLDAGADDYIAKPVEPVELRSRLAIGRRILEYQHTLDNLSHELQTKNSELSRIASVDGLTGIAGRSHFDARLGNEWRRALRDSSRLSVVLVDIDFFKDYNDTYGHAAGDECLKKIARTLAANVARAGDHIARYGGEEFAVILPGTDRLGALVVAEAIRVAVATLAIENKASTIHRYVTVSVGTATLVPTERQTQDALVAAADQALYDAKSSGRNVVRQA